MSTHEHIPSSRQSALAARPQLDRARRSPTVPRVTDDAGAPRVTMTAAERAKELGAQPWARITKQVAAIVYKRIRCRSMRDAEEIAQAAVVEAFESPESGGWDPAKGTLMACVVARAVGAAQNERRRKRNLCEVWIDEEIEDGEDAGVGRHEKHMAAEQPAADEALHRLRFASTVVERALARLAGHPFVLVVAEHMKQGFSSPTDIARLIGGACTEVEVRTAKKRIQYHVDQITKELSAAATAPRASGRDESEVTQ
jgi:DNA-directed RNA polymerase specialized sigma24 family protein